MHSNGSLSAWIVSKIITPHANLSPLGFFKLINGATLGSCNNFFGGYKIGFCSAKFYGQLEHVEIVDFIFYGIFTINTKFLHHQLLFCHLCFQFNSIQFNSFHFLRRSFNCVMYFFFGKYLNNSKTIYQVWSYRLLN